MAAIAALLAALVGTVTWIVRSPAPAPPAQMRRFLIAPPPGAIDHRSRGVAGRSPSRDGGNPRPTPASRRLYLRSFDQLEPRELPGTEGATQPFFSPDGAWVGFEAHGKLKKVALAGGSPIAICDVQRHARRELGAERGHRRRPARTGPLGRLGRRRRVATAHDARQERRRDRSPRAVRARRRHGGDLHDPRGSRNLPYRDALTHHRRPAHHRVEWVRWSGCRIRPHPVCARRLVVRRPVRCRAPGRRRRAGRGRRRRAHGRR